MAKNKKSDKTIFEKYESVICNIETDNKVAFINTGILGVNWIMGGGLPLGRIIEIYGPEHAGKTTLALAILASAQKQGKKVLFIDAEHSLDLSYADLLGLDINEFTIIQPDYGEQGLQAIEDFIKAGLADIVCVDSVAALTAKKEVDGEMTDKHMGLLPLMMAQSLRKLVPVASKHQASVIFINQIRMKMNAGMFENPEDTPGGKSLKHNASIRLRVSIREKIKKGEEVIGNRVKVKCVKNKVAFPFREAQFNLMFGKGIDRKLETIDLAVEYDIIKREGTTYLYGKKKLGVGAEKTKRFLTENKDIYKEIKSEVISKMSEESR